jgi:hypothetical protein
VRGGASDHGVKDSVSDPVPTGFRQAEPDERPRSDSEASEGTPIHQSGWNEYTSKEGLTSAPASQVRPSHYWTWRVLSAGFSAEECEAIRGIGRDVIVDHMLRAAEEGQPVRAEWCLSGELIDALRRTVGAEEPERVGPLLSCLPPGTRYEEVQLFLKCRKRHPDEF